MRSLEGKDRNLSGPTHGSECGTAEEKSENKEGKQSETGLVVGMAACVGKDKTVGIFKRSKKAIHLRAFFSIRPQISS